MSKFDRRLKRTTNLCGVTRKRMFRSPNAAMHFVAELGSECGAPLMRPYHCLFCNSFHLTSQEYDPAKRMAAYERHRQEAGVAFRC